MSQYQRLLQTDEPNTSIDAGTLISEAGRIVSPELQIDAVERPRNEKRDGVVVLRGRLIVHNDMFFDRWLHDFRRLGYTPLLRRDEEEHDRVAVHVLAGIPRQSSQRLWINIALFIVTFISTLFVGALYGATNIESLSDLYHPGFLLQGLPFALTLLGILGAHEFGHYFAARYHKVSVTLPYFIPMPLGFGTLGAVIQMKEPVPDRRKLFDIGVAGPLAGSALAVPLLLAGLATSPVSVIHATPGAMLEGNSILYYFAKFAVFGQPLPNPQTGIDVMMNQVTFAAWIGLLVTAINLLPVGQLDGGHAVYALFGKNAKYINISMLVIMGLLAIAGIGQLQRLFPPLVSVGYLGWFVWLGLIAFLIGPFHPPALDDVNELDPYRRVVGYFVIFLIIVLFVPVPFRPLL